jgi:prevent-host-death family protein
MSAITASKLRENVYRILDQVLETGVPIEIVRRGKKLRIVPSGERPAGGRLDNLPERHHVIAGDPEDLIHVDWSKRWRRKPS